MTVQALTPGFLVEETGLWLLRMRRMPARLPRLLWVLNFSQEFLQQQSLRRLDLPCHFLPDTLCKSINHHGLKQQRATYRLKHTLDAGKQGTDFAKALTAAPHTSTHLLEDFRSFLSGGQACA